MVGYAFIVLEAIIATRPRVSSRAMLLDAEFEDAAGAQQRLRVVVPHWNHDLDGVTRGSRILIGGDVRLRPTTYITAQETTVLWQAPEDDSNERASPRVHHVEAHWRHLASGRRIRVNAHVRGRAGIARSIKNLATRELPG